MANTVRIDAIYNISFFNYTSGDLINTTIISASCENACDYEVDVPSYLCSQSVNINITLSATNRFGQGPPSNPTILGK